MNKRILFRFVLLALFLFAYQTTTIHSKHHFIEEFSECHLCETSKLFEANQNKTAFPIFTESLAVEVSEIEEKIIVKETFDLTQTPLCKGIDFVGFKQFHLKAPSFTYYAMAPPYFFS